MIRKLMIGAGLAALAAAAIAADTAPAPMADKDMTRDELVAKVREHFGKLDTNKDGVIAADEIEAMGGGKMRMMRMGDHGPGGMAMHDADPNAAFDRIDENKDGSISRDEFAKHRQMRIENVVIRTADGKDAMTKDGKRPREMRMKHMGGGMGGHMIVMADSDHDGRITLAEAQAMALKHFDEMDANHDGKVTPDERKAARPMMWKMHEMHTEHAPKAS